MDDEKKAQMNRLQERLARGGMKFSDFVKGQPGQDQDSKRKQVTSCFASVLAFAQVGACEIV